MSEKIISYSKWNRMGRLGNQMFELASLYGMGRRYDRTAKIPGEWKYQKWFKEHVPTIPAIAMNRDINEPHYHHDWKYWDEEIGKRKSEELISVGGWLQSCKYFSSKEDVKALFEFKDGFKNALRHKWGEVFKKPVIAITIRHGKDYVDNGNYEILPVEYYVGALYRYFSDWQATCNIIVFSDDFEWAKLHFDCADNIYFTEGLSDIEQLCLASMCSYYILANSTFSWWCAYLSENPNAVIVRPKHYFTNYLLQTSDTKDLWPPQWHVFDHRGYKLSMKDVEFHIPVTYDHKDRAENLSMVMGWIDKYFNTNVVIGEQKTQHFRNIYKGKANYIFFGGFPKFHRTAMLNYMARGSLYPIIVNFDADNVCPILQMMIGVDMIRREKADVVYPYDGRVARVPRKEWYSKLKQDMDFGVFKGQLFRGTRTFDPKSVGHIIIWNKQKFFEGGGENENFISYGPEDVERFQRFSRLGYKIERVRGIVYHMDHYCGPNSGGSNPAFGKNYEELHRIQKLTDEQLRREVGNWRWTKYKKIGAAK